jgi:peroxiredoxin
MAILAALPLMGASPGVGERPPGFTLNSLTGKAVKLTEVSSNSPIALVVLRGYPGYQCPLCQRQVQDFVQNAHAFEAAGIRVLLVYPGPPDNLDVRAREFAAGKDLPDSIQLLLDPGYTFTNLYGLRWDSARETAYPSTFLLDHSGTIFYSQIAKLHGGRTSATAILGLFKQLGPARK